MAEGFDFNIDEVMRNLDLTEQRVNKGLNNVLKESAEPLKSEMQQNTNVSNGSSHRYGEGHARDNVEITAIKGGATDEKYVEVGFNKKVAWRMYFVEFGTVYQRPQNIVQRSITAKKSEVLRKQQEGMKGLLNL
ncbi:HK97 gp10 family phage protein [Enterococcus sp. BWM-S5]|uniref:HK97 gp10 family phage protein n=1 Tax=Enterococcus larvae TaxID=2794352 RepID=A0ABS4CF21_9ENTE|nr:HK97-gp10 family putative phage morphogenesis protein [Enterococcus larvae]MBP1044847.1 HK97 gp10 family phage protein [Enterococcus larvae]